MIRPYIALPPPLKVRHCPSIYLFTYLFFNILKSGTSGRSSSYRQNGNGDSGPSKRMHSESEPVDNEYYNFLHVSRNATSDEITAAYKKLSRLYHPDKHIDETKKQQALIMFTKLKNSYEGM